MIGSRTTFSCSPALICKKYRAAVSILVRSPGIIAFTAEIGLVSTPFVRFRNTLKGPARSAARHAIEAGGDGPFFFGLHPARACRRGVALAGSRRKAGLQDSDCHDDSAAARSPPTSAASDSRSSTRPDRHQDRSSSTAGGCAIALAIVIECCAGTTRAIDMPWAGAASGTPERTLHRINQVLGKHAA